MMTDSSHLNPSDVPLYQSSQRIARQLTGLIQELQDCTAQSFENDALNTFITRVSTLTKDAIQIRKLLLSAGETTRANGLSNAANELRTQLNLVERRHREYQEDQIKRDLRIANPDMTADQVDEIAREHPQLNVFELALKSPKALAVDGVRTRVGERHEAIIHIEKQMHDLKILFEVLEKAIFEQGKEVDYIEERGQEAAEHARQGANEAQRAVESAKAARRKRKWCIVVMGLVVVTVIVVAAVVATVISKR